MLPNEVGCSGLGVRQQEGDRGDLTTFTASALQAISPLDAASPLGKVQDQPWAPTSWRSLAPARALTRSSTFASAPRKLERELIERATTRAEGNRAEAACLLDIPGPSSMQG